MIKLGAYHSISIESITPRQFNDKLAKQVYGHLAPATTYHGLMPNSSVSVWLMEVIAGIGYLFIASTITTAKLDITVTDFAKFYAALWKTP